MKSYPKWLISVHHDGSEVYVADLYPGIGDRVKVRLRLSVKAPVKRILLRIYPDGEQSYIEMKHTYDLPPAAWWEAELPIDQPMVNYRFLIVAGDGLWFYNATGVQDHDPPDYADFRILANFQPVEWLSDAVFYQIFPDRFANGDLSNDPRPDEFEYHGRRPQTYPWESPPDAGQHESLVFYGGDLPGILQRLDYLQELGVNALYLNPVFSAHSNHKYDVVDYYNVDPHFGGNEALITLRQALDERGMRYILDIVPNHCGYWNPWFEEARREPVSQEAEFFTFNNHPDDYLSWLGVWSLPKFNYQSEELRRRFFAGEDSIFRRWLRPPYSADGWRVDVANMLARQGAWQQGAQIARGIRKAVKDARGEAYLMGENFFDASSQLQGDQFDGVMNYSGMTIPLLRWLRGYRHGAHGLKDIILSEENISTRALEASWRARRSVIPWAVTNQQYNLLGSHDVPRISTEVKGNMALHRLAAIVQFTFPGMPGIYYGDEIGMMDTPELKYRACMIWDESRWDHDLLAFYKNLIALRRKSKTLQRGGFQMLDIGCDHFAYQRESNEGRILVVANRGKEPLIGYGLPVEHGGILNGTHFREYFSGRLAEVVDGILNIENHGQGASVWEEIQH